MASSKLKTIILRFRDLSVSDTIQRHNDICESLGYVWWGWWSKPQEKIPFDEFALLERKAHEDDGFEWFLFDSGKKCLYKALCTDIRYKTTGERMECPEKDKTPSYYSDSIYLAWFKFAQITGPLQNSEALSLLRKHSYLRVDHFFESERSAFTPFYNKRVYSLDELADQQRTIWFIRNFEKGDSSHEIHSFSSSLNDDKNVDQEFRILPTQDVLWISDLHFSNRHHAFGILPGSDNRLQTRLHKELSELNQKEHTLSHIIISGDLTFEASKEEYASALEFVNFMRSTYNLNDNCYSICPGNHDLKFSEKPYAEDDKVTIAYDSSKEAYIDFYRQVFGADPTESLYSIRRFLTPDLVPIEVIAINSCLLQQDKDHFRGMGYVGNDQRNEIEGKIVENTLISYLDKHIAALKKGERFELFSASTGINYCNLVHYISAPEEKYYSRRLSMRISQIINNNLSQMYYFYCEYAKFDFSRFDVSWLLNLYPHTLEQIAKNAKVKERVRVAIATTLDGEAIAPSDSQRLQSILVKHFC